MSVLSITFMDPVCLEIMFGDGYPNESRYGVIRNLENKT